MRKLILASASSWRKNILERTNIPFTIEESGYAEDITLPLSPHELAKHLALGKAETVAVRHRDAVIVGADSVIVIGKKILAKPETAARARAMLAGLSGKTNIAITGVAIIDFKTGKKTVFSCETKVTFRKLSKAEIAAYVRTGEPLYVAGGYAIQNGAASFVEHLEGDFYNVVGLPLSKVLETLRKFGISAH